MECWNFLTRSQIQLHLPLPEAPSQEPGIGHVLAVLVGDQAAAESGGLAAGSVRASPPPR